MSLDLLIKDVEDALGTIGDSGHLNYELPGGMLSVEKDITGYFGHLFIDGKTVYEFNADSASEIVDGLMTRGWLQPQCSARNSEHTHHLNTCMETMEMSMSEKLLDAESDAAQKDLAADDDPLTQDDRDTDNDGEHDDEEILADLSSDEFNEMDATRQELVRQLMDKHNTGEPPQISDYPGGGHEVRVFGDDGFYYYYLVTPEDEVVHLAIMGKNMKNKIGPTLEDMAKKSSFDFFKKMDIDERGISLKKTLILGDDNLIYPMQQDYETGIGNNVTVTLKNAINQKADELMATLDSITNNNDGTYKVVFSKWPENGFPIQANPTLIAFNIDRDGNLTPTSSEVMMMKNKTAFKDFAFTPTTDELQKSMNRKIILRKKEDVVKKGKPVTEAFMKSASISDLLEDRKKEVLNAQVKAIKNPMSAKVNW